MGKVKQVFVDLEQEGPEQEPDAVEIVAVAVPWLLEYVCYALAAACCLVWLVIGNTGGKL